MKQVLILAWAGVTLFATGATAKPGVPTAVAEMTDAQGKAVGQVVFTQTDAGVRMSIKVHGLTPGEHGIHIHKTGKCTAPDFKSAEDHFDVAVKEHGLRNPKGPHSGDLPSLQVKEDGTATVEMTNERVTLGKGANSLLKKGGTALVIHAKADDQMTSPSGGSGDRIACGVIQAEKKPKRKP